MAFDYFHAVNVPFRMQPGLRKLAPGSPQLTPNTPGARHLREKLAVLSTQPQQALCAVPGFDPRPALHAVCEQAQAEHPQALGWHSATATLQAHWLGWAASAAGEISQLPPGQAGEAAVPWGTVLEVGCCLQSLPAEWRLTGLLCLALQEDLAVVDGHTATLPWLAVALPSHWAPLEKMGRHFAEVHAQVADSQVLVAAGAHLMRLVCNPGRWERFVWNITPEPRLNQHPQRVSPTQWQAILQTCGVDGHGTHAASGPPSGTSSATTLASHLASAAWFRTERQTFIPLPERGQAVFTIQVDCQPLEQAVSTPAQAERLHAALASMSPAVLRYRNLSEVQAPLLQWLEQQAGPTGDH
jgi:hypothetical protein